MKRYNLPRILLLSIIFISALLIGSVFFLRAKMNEFGLAAGNNAKEYKAHYAFIYDERDNDIYNSIYLGAEAAGKDTGVYVERFGLGLISDYSVDEFLEIATDAAVDGIIVAGNNDSKMGTLINNATEAGIPVVTVGEDCSESSRVSFVGLSEYTLGRTYGEQVASLIKNDGVLDIYVTFPEQDFGAGQDIIITGILDVLDEKGIMGGYSIEAIYIDDSNAFSAEEDIRDIFLGEKTLPDVMICPNAGYTRCAFQAAVDYNKVGEVILLGFFDSNDILEAASKNILQGTVALNTTEMGALCVEALNEYIETGYVSTYMAQDASFVDSKDAEILLTQEDGN